MFFPLLRTFRWLPLTMLYIAVLASATFTFKVTAWVNLGRLFCSFAETLACTHACFLTQDESSEHCGSMQTNYFQEHVLPILIQRMPAFEHAQVRGACTWNHIAPSAAESSRMKS